jgi:hypothetical protein
VIPLPDFLCNLGGVMSHQGGGGARASELRSEIERKINHLVDDCFRHADGPFRGACRLAEEYLRTWRSPDDMPRSAPYAPYRAERLEPTGALT